MPQLAQTLIPVYTQYSPCDATVKGIYPTQGGCLLVTFSGSGYSESGNAMIGAELIFNGESVAQALVYTNEANSHKAFVPVTVFLDPYTTPEITWEINFIDTSYDENDWISITIQELI